MSNPTLIYAGNVLVALVALGLVFTGHVTWEQAMMLVAAMLMPSAAHVGVQQRAMKREMKQKAALLPPTTIMCLALSIVGCGLTTKDAEDIGKVSATILCVLEHEELDDEALNKACDVIQGQLTPEQAKTIRAHATAAKKARAACKPQTDGGAP